MASWYRPALKYFSPPCRYLSFCRFGSVEQPLNRSAPTLSAATAKASLDADFAISVTIFAEVGHAMGHPLTRSRGPLKSLPTSTPGPAKSPSALPGIPRTRPAGKKLGKLLSTNLSESTNAIVAFQSLTRWLWKCC